MAKRGKNSFALGDLFSRPPGPAVWAHWVLHRMLTAAETGLPGVAAKMEAAKQRAEGRAPEVAGQSPSRSLPR